MTTQNDLNLKVARLLGWRLHKESWMGDNSHQVYRPDGSVVFVSAMTASGTTTIIHNISEVIPDYANNLNVIIEAIKQLGYGYSIHDVANHRYVEIHSMFTSNVTGNVVSNDDAYVEIKGDGTKATARALCAALVEAEDRK